VKADTLLTNLSTELRRHLLAAHQLTNIQRLEQLFNLLPLAAQKPSELLLRCYNYNRSKKGGVQTGDSGPWSQQWPVRVQADAL
jgi:hypothetical protein